MQEIEQSAVSLIKIRVEVVDLIQSVNMNNE